MYHCDSRIVNAIDQRMGGEATEDDRVRRSVRAQASMAIGNSGVMPAVDGDAVAFFTPEFFRTLANFEELPKAAGRCRCGLRPVPFPDDTALFLRTSSRAGRGSCTRD